MKGIRADVMLFERGLAKSREKARSLIMAGMVFNNGVRVEKSGDMLSEDAVLTVKEDPIPFVSRGGLKLKKAFEHFSISVEGKTALDLGASTGGFTDCMLKNGAKRVYAIDVGYGQLDWSLRNDERVVVMERTNARLIESGWFESVPEFATLDLSFISVKLILTPLFAVLAENAEVVVLVKPQFEAGKDKVGKNGIIRDATVHADVLRKTVQMTVELGYSVIGIDYSPIKGPKGNIEFLAVLKKTQDRCGLTDEQIEESVATVVESAHANLDKAE